MTEAIIFHLRTRQPRGLGRPGYSSAHFRRVTNTYPEVKTVCGDAATVYDTNAARCLVGWVRPADGQRFEPCADCAHTRARS